VAEVAEELTAVVLLLAEVAVNMRKASSTSALALDLLVQSALVAEVVLALMVRLVAFQLSPQL
jgi:hypothetical protein